MGIYATTTSFSRVLPGYFKGNTHSSDSEGTAICAKQIENAEAKINAIISSRYDIASFVSIAIPPLLRALTEDIAAYNVIRSSGYRANNENEYLDDFNKANDMLKQLANGEMNLTFSDGSAVSVQSTQRFLSSTKGYTSYFGRDSATSWKRDKDEIADLKDERSG